MKYDSENIHKNDFTDVEGIFRYVFYLFSIEFIQIRKNFLEF